MNPVKVLDELNKCINEYNSKSYNELEIPPLHNVSLSEKFIEYWNAYCLSYHIDRRKHNHMVFYRVAITWLKYNHPYVKLLNT